MQSLDQLPVLDGPALQERMLESLTMPVDATSEPPEQPELALEEAAAPLETVAGVPAQEGRLNESASDGDQVPDQNYVDANDSIQGNA